MRYTAIGIVLLYTFSVSAETLTGNVLQVRDNVAYVKTTDGKKVPVILNDKTYYRKKRIIKKGKENIEVYQPLMSRGNKITLTYDTDTTDPKTGSINASDVLITVDN